MTEPLDKSQNEKPISFVCEFDVLRDLDTAKDPEKIASEIMHHPPLALHLIHRASLIVIRVGDKEVVVKDRHGIRRDCLTGD